MLPLEDSLVVPRNVKHRVTTWPRNSTLRCILKQMKMHFSSKIYIWMSMTKKQKIKATQVSINSWVNKILYIHTVENYPSLYILTVENYPSLRHHWLDGHESEWTLAVGDGQGGLVCCNSWGCKASETTERLNWTELKKKWSFDTCYNMAEPSRHYAKWKEPVIKGHFMCDSIYMKCSK